MLNSIIKQNKPRKAELRMYLETQDTKKKKKNQSLKKNLKSDLQWNQVINAKIKVLKLVF